MTTAAAGNRVRNRALVAGGAVVLIGVIGFLALKGPSAPEPSPSPGIAADPPATPIVVSINRAGGGPAHVGYPESVTVSALGSAGIAGVELWAGGELVADEPTADPERPAATIPVEWVPGAAGETILAARAYDAEGRTGISSVLRITVDEEVPQTVQLVEVQAAPGQTLGEVVEASGGDSSMAEAWNPGMSLTGPFTVETTVTVPIAGDAPVARGPASADLASARVAFAATLPAGLSAPEPTVTVDACKLIVSAPDSSTTETGYLFSVLPPGSLAFLNVGTFAPASGGSVGGETLALGGTNYVTISAYDGQVSAPSAILPVAVPDECNDGWEGDARLAGNELVLPAAVDRAYFYLKVADDGWQRVPSAPGTFIEPVNGKFDATGMLPVFGNEPLRLEAWGWKDGALVSRGSGSYTPPGTQQLYGGAMLGAGPFLAGFGTSLDIRLQAAAGEFSEVLTRSSSIDRPGPGSQSASRTFKWETTVPGVTHVLWQITPYPLGDGASLTPPFLVDSDTFVPTNPKGGTFTIDFAPYLTDGGGVADVYSWADQQVLSQIVAVPVLPGAGSPSPTPGSGIVDAPVIVGLGGPFLPAGGATVGEAALGDLALFAPPLTVLYVRVIPMTGAAPAGAASNSVSFDIVEPGEPMYIDTSPPPPPPTYTDAYQMSGIFYAPTGAIAKYSRCVRVVEAPPTPLPLIWAGQNWGAGTVHCYVEPDDDFSLLDAFEAFTEWVGTAWDYLSSAYTWIQDQVVTAVLAIVPCEQIANEVADNGKESCKVLAKTALHVAMAAYGVPPEIPSWDSTIAGLKGDMAEFVVAQARAQYPLVADACDAAALANASDSDFPTCKKLVEEAIDEVVEQVMEERSAAAAKTAGVAIPPGALVEPDPRGFAQPPHFSVTLTRTNAPLPATVSCKVTAHMTSDVASWSWLEYQWSGGDPTTVKKSGAVNGEPFLQASVGFAHLDPGASTTFEVWMTKPATWFEPDGWNDHYAEQYALWNGEHNHAWVLLQKGATVKAKLTSNCAPTAAGTQVLTGNAWQ